MNKTDFICIFIRHVSPFSLSALFQAKFIPDYFLSPPGPENIIDI